jgi:SAM-dependent methyltransferase
MVMLRKFIGKIRGAYRALEDSTDYHPFGDVERFCAEYGAAHAKRTQVKTLSLDIGCGSAARNLFGAEVAYGIDIIKNQSGDIRAADLTVDPIPFESDLFDYVIAHDFIEHVPRVIYNPGRRFPFVELMNEIHRVLKKDGVFISITPAYPFRVAFIDPTHVNVIDELTFSNYFSTTKLAAMYGFRGSFSMLKQGWRHRHLVTVLKKT